MAVMNEKAVMRNFDSFFDQEDSPEKLVAGGISYVPTLNLLAMVTSVGEVVVFSGRASSVLEDGLQSFKPKANIILENDRASCVYLLPVATKKSSIIGGSWCAIAVGSRAGTVSFHNEEGVLLLRQNLFTQPVNRVCLSLNAALQGYVYATSGATVNMIHYNELVAELESRFNSMMLCPDVRVPPSAALAWKSLRLQQVKNTQQVMLTNHGVSECYFDQLERCTMEQHGLGAQISNATNLLVSSVGSDPFYSLTMSRETTQTNLVTDIAVAVANKFGRMISDNVPFWGGKSTATAEVDEQPKISQLGVLSQHGLFDRDRLGTQFCLSPSKRFVALIDSLARVILIDSTTGVPLHIMKGYRRAQLGWITSSTLDTSARHVELLVIYSAKSLQIELWNTRKSSRVTAFSAPAGIGMLLYDSGSIAAGPNDDNFSPMDRQAYFLAKSGHLYDIKVSFSEALEFEDLSEMQGHLDDLGEVRKILEGYDSSSIERFGKLLKRFKRVSLVQQVVRMVCDCPNADEELINVLLMVLDGKSLRGARKATLRIQTNLSKIRRLLEVYAHIKLEANQLLGECRELPHCVDFDSVEKFQGVFQYNDDDDCLDSATLRLCDILGSFAISADSVDPLIVVEEGEEAECFIAKMVCAMATSESFFRLLYEQDICLLSITRCLLHGLFASTIKAKQRVSKTLTAFGHILEELEAHGADMEPFLTEVYEEISATGNIPSAMLASYMMQVCLGPQNASLLDDVEVSLECKIFAGLFKQLQSILPLAALLRCHVKDEAVPAGGVDVVRNFSVSLKSLRKCEGHISDIVSQWICEQRLSHEHLRRALNTSSGVACLEDSLVNCTISLDVALQLLCDVRLTFPVSLQLETLVANCCWSYLCLWDQNFEDAELLRWSLGFVRAIQAYKLKEGLCHMIWKSHLQMRVITMSRIMEQTGMLPEVQLERHVQVGKCALGEFFNFCSTILDIIIECMLPSEDVEILCPLLKEEVLSEGFSEADPSLISRALSLPRALRETVHLHYSLVTILATCVTFNLDDTHPLSLFDSAAQSALSADLCQVYTPYNQSAAKGALSNHRIRFLHRAVEGCVQRLPEVYRSEELLECQSTLAGLIDLAHSWDIDTDVVNKEYVLQLYSSGHDQLAQEVLSQISDRRTMADALLVLVGLRVRALLGDIDKDSCEKLGVVPTRVQRWLAKLPDKTLRCTDRSSDSILNLVQNVLFIVPNASFEAQLLSDVTLLLTNLPDVAAIPGVD